MTYICLMNGEKVGEVDANSEEEALEKAVHLFGLEVDVELK